ncbi:MULTISPECIES: hypothetical protein [Niastella]|uniref:Uncharacterized protein n=1 Tax=Niastella soli TaxID=2821487 RepID=A0ABS3YZ67_9BACT|nr:hypothetical protein [Niastella soli]MBO9202797.1 hypothetical protein [Niastella soli]
MTQSAGNTIKGDPSHYLTSSSTLTQSAQPGRLKTYYRVIATNMDTNPYRDHISVEMSFSQILSSP